jgi:conjugal transfer ATP-binding protein TraC
MKLFNFGYNENEASRLFRPLAYDNFNLFLCDDQTAGFAFLCNPSSGWDTKMLSTIGLMLNDDYPVDSILSFTLWASPDIKAQIYGADKLRAKCKDELLRVSQDTAMGFLWEGTRNELELMQGTRVRDFKLIVTYKMPIKDVSGPSEDEHEKLRKTQTKMQQRLNMANFSASEVNAQYLVDLMNSMVNWQPSAQWRTNQNVELDDSRVLNEQFTERSTRIIKKNNGVILKSPKGETHCRLLTVRKMPKQTRVGMAYRWFGDPFEGQGCVTQPFMITTNIHFPDANKTKKAIESKRARYLKNSFDALTLFAPKIKDMTGELDDLTKSFKEHRPVKVSLTACVFGQNENEAEEGVVALQGFMSSCGTKMVDEDAFAIPSFINTLPFGACLTAVKKSQRYFTMSTKQAMPILPIFADWKGTGTPTLQFVSRTGQIMNIDLFDSDTNFNTVIYAESGAGKSFLTNEIIRSYLSTGQKAWAIDAGESYKKLSSSFQGKYTAFNEDNDISINPFTMIPENDPAAFNDSLEMLAGCILAMGFTKEEPSDFQVSEIETILTDLWHEKGQRTLIDDVAERCLIHPERRISDIGSQLKAFTTQGRFGRYFDRPHTIKFDGSFNVLELDGLSETPRLQAVVLFMLMVQITHELYNEYKYDRNIKRLVIIDEAWDLLGNNPAVAQFMEKGFRRMRKYNGAGVVVTQSIFDLQKSDAGRAIAENAALSLILRQQDSTIAKAEKENLMSIPPAAYRMLRKVTTESGVYSEIFFKTNRGMGIGRLIVDPLRVMMFSTKAADNSAIDANLGRMSLSESMIQVAKDRHMFRFDMRRPKFLNEKLYVVQNELAVSSYMGINSSHETEVFETMRAANE